MTSLQDAKKRKETREAALMHSSSKNVKENQTKKLTQSLIKHYWAVILNWTNESDITSSNALQSFLSLPINQTIPMDVLNAWEAELTASGYYIDRYDHIFKICLY